MRLDGPVTDLTEKQKEMAQIAGVPGDRPGLGAEYPKMVYRPGKNDHHILLNAPLKVAGFECQTAYVDDAEDEAQALADGWFLSPDPAAQAAALARRAEESAKDDKIAQLEAQLADKGKPTPPARGAVDAGARPA